MKNMEVSGNRDFLRPLIPGAREIEGSMLLLARKKIILPERIIIVENPTGPSLLQYQSEIDGEFTRTSTGIIITR